MGDSLPFLVMVLLQVGYAGMNILSKLAMNSGMNPLIQVAYRQIFASIVIVPFAYFLERYTHCLWSHGMCIMRVRMHVI